MTTTPSGHIDNTDRMSTADVKARLDELGDAAEQRMRMCTPDFVSLLGGAAIDFMTPEERAERHELVMQLPTFHEERQAARARIQARIAERRNRSAQTAALKEKVSCTK
ncbi:hypothetical protein [Duganella vulcania]|uniref:Uncharacterized protein n=1 Tax=Duganella vulcania TaxID=2692166 RepID=A0A845GHS7_9BURK|nr:hypothetical protein [Duganella vulcania]MYM92598.1 hypothetical protein [Duganella vulcania]